MIATVAESIGTYAACVAAIAAAVGLVYARQSARAGADAARAAKATVEIAALARRDNELHATATRIKETLRAFQAWARDAEAFHKRMGHAFTHARCPQGDEIPDLGEELYGLDAQYRELELDTMIVDLEIWRQNLLIEEEVVAAVRVAEKTAASAWTGVFKMVNNYLEKPSPLTAFGAIFSFNKRLNDPNPWSLAFIATFSGDLANAISRSQKRVVSPDPRVVSPEDRRHINWLSTTDAGTWELHLLYRDRALAGFTKP
jgi:hypothetical protein